MNSNIYARPYTMARACPVDTYCLVLFKEDNSYVVEKKTQLPIPDKSGLVKMRFQKQVMVGMIIREGRYWKSHYFILQQDMNILGSKDECEKAGRGLELAIRTDIESEAEFSHSSQNKIEQHKENSNSLSTVKPSTSNLSVLPPFSELVNRNNQLSDAHNLNATKGAKDVQDNSKILNVPTVSSDSDESDEFDMNDDILDELQQMIKPKKQNNNKKRKKPNQITPAAKRLAATTCLLPDDSPTLSTSTSNEIYNILKRIDNNCQANKVQLEQLVIEQKRTNNIMRLLFDNQKRIQKRFAALQIHIPLTDPQDDGEKADVECSSSFHKSLEWCVGTSDPIDVLLLPSDPTNKTRYATKVLSIVFASEDLENIQPNTITCDERYLFVKEAVRSKFKLDSAQMALQWPAVHEAIMQKRRNNRRDRRASDKKD